VLVHGLPECGKSRLILEAVSDRADEVIVVVDEEFKASDLLHFRAPGSNAIVVLPNPKSETIDALIRAGVGLKRLNC